MWLIGYERLPLSNLRVVSNVFKLFNSQHRPMTNCSWSTVKSIVVYYITIRDTAA